MLYSETKQQTKLNERLLTSSVFRENPPFFQGCSKKQITCVSQIAQLCAAVHTTVWYIGAFNSQNNKKKQTKKSNKQRE